MKANVVLSLLGITRPTLAKYVKDGTIKATLLSNGSYDYDGKSVEEFSRKKTKSTKNLTAYKGFPLPKLNQEPVWLNLFDIMFDITSDIQLEMDGYAFKGSDIYKSVDLIQDATISTDKHLVIKFGDLLNEDNSLYSYTLWLELFNKKFKIPKITVNIFNRKGDIFIQYEFKDVIVESISNIDLSYLKGAEQLMSLVNFVSEKQTIKFFRNGETIGLE